MVISVGYRVKSQKGVQFRQWATQVLKQQANYANMGKQIIPVTITIVNREALTRYLSKWQIWQKFISSNELDERVVVSILETTTQHAAISGNLFAKIGCD